ncbi:MAG: transglutaminase domain-containing protein, partial [Thermomicrobiales bacterium]|nr:transglutaminase domain-containing protein [Thermomicrobiales bacterium]
DSDFGGGSYATFGDKFRLGGALDLSDEPVMIFRPTSGAAGPTYLIGHRYDGYDGHGWATLVGDTFQAVNAEGDRYSAQMTFARGQAVHLSPQVLTDRAEARGTVEVLRSKGDLLFTRDTYLTADQQTNVQLSWRQLDEAAFDLAGGDLSVAPLDLRLFAQTLRQAAWDPAAAGGVSPLPADAGMAAEIARQSDELRRRFLDTSWTVGPDGRVQTLVVSGQVPVYDDVEAIYAARPLPDNAAYTIVGLLSAAPADALRAAGQEYPEWVTDRYLQLPDTVTPRTRELAARLAAGQPSVFDTAMAVQDYVRSAIRYEEQIQPPPSDRDVVDYVLFESQEGYCEYYASAMAVLLRSQNIPARVVAGYFAVPWDDAEQGYLYREKNAHLWVEVFFPGYGWIPFEPTASQDPLEYGDPGAAPLPTPTPEPPAPTPEPEATATPAAAVTDPTPPAFPPSLDAAGRALGWLGIAFGGMLLLAIVAAVVVWQWKLRGLSAAEGLYARALRVGRLWGVRASPAQTPIEFAERLGQAAPATRHSARIVADLYSQEIYADREPAPGALAAARAAWTDLRRAMLGAVLRRKS